MGDRRLGLNLVLTTACLFGPGMGVVSAARAAAPAKPAPPRRIAHRDIVRTGKKLYSRANEELIIRDFFQDRRGGVFLDVGCWRPIEASNTYYLEHHLGWSGIGIDALNELAPGWKRNRPASRFLNFIVTDKAGAREPFYRVEMTDISSVEKPVSGPAGKPVRTKTVMVPTTTLTKALDDNHQAHIDFMSMDIEGAEVPALVGFDIRRFHPLLVCIETKVRNRAQILAYFKSHGYRRLDQYLKYDKTNWYFAPAPSR